MIVEVFQAVGISADLKESQKIVCSIGDSSIAHSLSTLAGMPSGPGALPILHLLNCWRTSSTVNGGRDGESSGRALSSSSQRAEWSTVSKRVKKEFRESAEVAGLVVILCPVLDA